MRESGSYIIIVKPAIITHEVKRYEENIYYIDRKKKDM